MYLMSNFSAFKIFDIAQKLLGIVDKNLPVEHEEFHKAVGKLKNLKIDEGSLKTASEKITESDFDFKPFLDYKSTLESLISGEDPRKIPNIYQLSNEPSYS